MRRGELLGLKWDDLDLEQQVLQIKRALAPKGKSFNQPKSAKGRRRIGLTPEAVETLRRHRVAQNKERLRRGSLWQDHGLVFPSQVGTPMNPDNFVKPKVVQEMIGHSQISTTLDTYSHVLPNMQDEAVKRFGSLFS